LQVTVFSSETGRVKSTRWRTSKHPAQIVVIVTDGISNIGFTEGHKLVNIKLTRIIKAKDQVQCDHIKQTSIPRAED
jgi:hypothetical protein